MADTGVNQNQPIAIPEEIQVYLNRLLDESGMTGLEDSVRESMLQDLFLQLDDYIIEKVVDYLPEDKLNGFTDLMKQNPPKDQVEDYIRKNVPNAQDVFTVAFADFRDIYLQAAKDAQQEQTNA